jgi:hypothetical protein
MVDEATARQKKGRHRTIGEGDCKRLASDDILE